MGQEGRHWVDGFASTAGDEPSDVAADFSAIFSALVAAPYVPRPRFATGSESGALVPRALDRKSVV